MSAFTGQWGFEKPAATTQNKTAVYNADLDRLDEGRRFKAVAAGPLGSYLLTYVTSGRLVNLAHNANRPLLGFVSSSGTAVTTVSSGADVYTQVDGHIINSEWAFTPGLPVYAHPSAAGSITQTVPGSRAWPIAYAISSHQVAILPGGLHETHPTPEIFAGLIITGVASAGEVIASSRMATRHWGTTTPTGGISGEIAVASGYVYANDAGTWRSTPIAGAPSVRVNKSAPQSISDATVTPITFDQEDFDAAGLHDNVTNNTRLTANRAGKWHVWGMMGFAGNATGERIVLLYKNGVEDTRVGMNSPGANDLNYTFTATVHLDVGEYVEANAYQSSGGALDVTTFSRFGMEWVGV